MKEEPVVIVFSPSNEIQCLHDITEIQANIKLLTDVSHIYNSVHHTEFLPTEKGMNAGFVFNVLLSSNHRSGLKVNGSSQFAGST